MSINDPHSIRLSRRRLVATGLATGVSIFAIDFADGQTTIIDYRTASTQELLSTILAQTDPASSTNALVEVFARSGIAVFDDAVTQPLVPPEDPVSPLSFQRWQLESMVKDLAIGGRPVADYDAVFPTTTETGGDLPTAGELLAGYYGAATTAGAEFTRLYLDAFLPAESSVTAADIPAPTAIMSLLGGEIMGQIYEAGLGSTTKFVSGFTQAPPVPGIELPGLPHIPQLPQVPEVNIPQVPQVPGSTVCSMAQNFISTVQQRMFSVLDTVDEIASVPILGEITTAIKNGVKFGISLILKAVDTALAPVMNVIKAIGAGIAIASQILGTITPWTVTLDMRPTRTRFGIDAEVVSGEIGIVAGGWDQINWPPIIKECAAAVGIALPEPTAADAPVRMWVSQPQPLLLLNATSTRLDNTGQATISYVTQNETAEQAKGVEAVGVAWITAYVEREDLTRLRDQLLNLLFSQLPALIAQVVQPIIGPIATDLSNKLIALVTVSGTKPLFVTFHIPKDPELPDTPEDDDATGDCFPGVFQVKDPAIMLRSLMLGPAQIEVTGSLVWDFRADGTCINSYDGLTIAIVAGPGVAFTYTFSGQETGTYTTDGGILTVTILTSSVSAEVDEMAVQGTVSGSATGTTSGAYVCGNPVIWNANIPELGIVPFELIPINQ